MYGTFYYWQAEIRTVKMPGGKISKQIQFIFVFNLTNGALYARILWQQQNNLLIRSDTQEAEGAPLLRE